MAPREAPSWEGWVRSKGSQSRATAHLHTLQPTHAQPFPCEHPKPVPVPGDSRGEHAPGPAVTSHSMPLLGHMG